MRERKLFGENMRGWQDMYPRALRDPYCGCFINDGWIPLVRNVVALCEADNVEIHQIKEKFGGLWVYTGQCDSIRVRELIRLAEERSLTICEDCGKPGSLTNDRRYMLTLCGECKTAKGRK